MNSINEKISRFEMAMVILSLAGKPLHYDYDLNYMIEVIRNKPSTNTPWNTICRDISQRPNLFKSVSPGVYELAKTTPTSKQFVINKIGIYKYNAVIDLLKSNGFLKEDGKLNWVPHQKYLHLVSTNIEASQDNIQIKKVGESNWFPQDYSPKISVEKWDELLGNPEIFNESSLTIMKRMLDIGGQATCKQLAAKYGENVNFYKNASTALAERIAAKTGCLPYKKSNGTICWWSVLYLSKKATSDDEGLYIWKLRDELSQALNMINLSKVKLYASVTAQAENPLPLAENIKKYTTNDFLNEVYMSKKAYAELTDILKRKKNIILQGAPGVGKTFTAKRLAYSMMGEKDENRIEFVQFHQNYSYEDFVIGYKPDGDGFSLKNGIFYSFCQKAASDYDRDYFFIVDEINRGNMSKIFGELLMLIENNHRGTSLTLACNNLSFSVPKNLYIIGMMNTADRSLAMIDYALRRRFSFFNIAPGFDSDGFAAYQQNLNSKKLNDLVKELENLNLDIADDKSLGQGFCIGHSYLCGENNCTDAWLQGVVKYDILPMLAEYWFDDMEKYNHWAKRLTDAVK